MSNRALIARFEEWRQSGKPLALATVIHTEGSTYSKAGRQILITAEGEHAGLVSGGCLEGDLAEHAYDVIKTGTAKLVRYDMRDEADDLWGMGLGCNGLMQILLQPLSAGNSWQPFSDIATAMAQLVTMPCALVTANNAAEPAPGNCFIAATNNIWHGTTPPPNWLQAPHNMPAIVQHDSAGGATQVLYWCIKPWTRLLLLGAGPDSVPVVALANALGWEITVADHRPKYLDADKFAHADHTKLISPPSLTEHIDLESFDAVVVMSHHIETDQIYLGQLADLESAYVGLLGPTARKHKLLTSLQLADSKFAQRLHGPVGLNIGSDSPETIALALISEIQAVLHNALTTSIVVEK